MINGSSHMPYLIKCWKVRKWGRAPFRVLYGFFNLVKFFRSVRPAVGKVAPSVPICASTSIDCARTIIIFVLRIRTSNSSFQRLSSLFKNQSAATMRLVLSQALRAFLLFLAIHHTFAKIGSLQWIKGDGLEKVYNDAHQQVFFSSEHAVVLAGGFSTFFELLDRV